MKFVTSRVHGFGQKLKLMCVLHKVLYTAAQELDVDMFSLLVYPPRSRGKDGHFADAQIVSG